LEKNESESVLLLNYAGTESKLKEIRCKASAKLCTKERAIISDRKWDALVSGILF
jgi:hypothetical protein